ncbi:hypothetical protein ASPZODRAFT_115447 [Penicilliopsis zonata CBS 506.65]|uniref:Major facilitator superfamily (MFS) profile domain-containing protein n=1 Tax=Penicilliopsis zonata CBS 506.65 TaxID=1073090 RepID=A0A1L9SLH8_9EURO|nr:hypothetical protein ASPZODRAFT_115447 [Penicilliopsis zonata CBS 506.65]OJJ48030.1 hypothetical protein ASPZODRAFT_115447 [Penicilliopsis zonata CBS 506.65]
MPLRGNQLMAGITAACGMGFLLFGYDQGVMGGVIGSPSFVEQFNHPTNEALQQGLITGLYDLGCLIGSIASFVFAERIGRRKSIYIGAGIVTIGTILQVTAKTTSHLIVGRIVTGCGVGINTAIIPTWQAEVSPTHQRGILITVDAALIIAGLAIANWVAFGASYATSSFQWQFPIALQVVFSLDLLLTVPFLVESPRWTAHHRSLEEATTLITRLYDVSETDSIVIKTRDEIAKALEEERGGEWWEIFRNGEQQNLRRMLLGFGVLCMQQLSGINSIGYYLPVILTEYVGLSPTLSHILSSIAAVQFFLFALLPIWFIERVGRRTCMIWGALAQMMAMIFVAVGFNLPRGGPILITVMFFLFYDACALSYVPVPWMYAPEINNLKMRSKGGAIASASNWLFNGIVVTVTPSGLANIGWRYYLIWIVLNASFVPIVYFLYPETKGLSLEEIDHIFEGKRGWTQGVRV